MGNSLEFQYPLTLVFAAWCDPCSNLSVKLYKENVRRSSRALLSSSLRTYPHFTVINSENSLVPFESIKAAMASSGYMDQTSSSPARLPYQEPILRSLNLFQPNDLSDLYTEDGYDDQLVCTIRRCSHYCSQSLTDFVSYDAWGRHAANAPSPEGISDLLVLPCVQWRTSLNSDHA